MLLRRLVAALGPLLLCVLVCAVFRWLDGMMEAASFLAFLIKGVLLGAALALTLPLAGVRARTNGLTGWLLLGAGILAAALAYQYLETEGLVSVPVLRAMLSINGQVVLTEGAAFGYLCTTAALYRPRRLSQSSGERAAR
ncbi:MAG: hypothetical protein SOV75_02895 [Candidatus Limiplasma sp.]|nr:hypothetical protein [Candidatus Limiplasma sp.]